MKKVQTLVEKCNFELCTFLKMLQRIGICSDKLDFV